MRRTIRENNQNNKRLSFSRGKRKMKIWKEVYDGLMILNEGWNKKKKKKREIDGTR